MGGKHPWLRSNSLPSAMTRHGISVFLLVAFKIQQNGVITVITYNYVSPTFNLKPVKERRAEKWRSPCQRSRRRTGQLQQHGRLLFVCLWSPGPTRGSRLGPRKTGDLVAKRPLLLRKDLSTFPLTVGLHDNVSQKHQSGLNRCWLLKYSSLLL